MESCLSCVAMLVAGLWVHVVLCSYVPRGRSRFTYCMFTNSRRKTFAAAVPPLSTHSFQPILLSISSFGETTLHLRIDSWFYQVETPFGGWLVAVSILFVPFWNSPLSAHWEALRLP